ncbi:MAG: hypothetical protein M1350_07000 [Actinobacteria bacterium]|nr:hypothetical protein [Actinomycetota bacterium]
MTGEYGVQEAGKEKRARGPRKGMLAIAAAFLAAGGGGYELAAAVATTPSSTAAVNQVKYDLIQAMSVDANTMVSPIRMSHGLVLPDFRGALQKEITATSSPWYLCPASLGGGVNITQQAADLANTYYIAEVKKYFTGVALPQEISGQSLNQPTKVAPCSKSVTPWIAGPAVVSIYQWNYVNVSGNEATASAILGGSFSQCVAAKTAASNGAYAFKCQWSPSDHSRIYNWSLRFNGTSGIWQIDYMKMSFVPGKQPG